MTLRASVIEDIKAIISTHRNPKTLKVILVKTSSYASLFVDI